MLWLMPLRPHISAPLSIDGVPDVELMKQLSSSSKGLIISVDATLTIQWRQPSQLRIDSRHETSLTS